MARGAIAAGVAAQSNLAVTARQQTPVAAPSSVPANFQLDPYLDYGRFLTPEGGILIIYKDIDARLRHTLWRLLAWSTFTLIETNFLIHQSPIHAPWIKITALLIVAVVNWLIVAKPIELYRRIEIRPDCMILDGSDIFWSRFMEAGLPAFSPDKDDNQILCGIYGTRFVEYLTVRRFDDLDRMPEVFAAHLQDAMRQQWMRPQ
jgi:hypothetical protein